MAGDQPKDWWKNANSIYEFSLKDIDGQDVSLNKYSKNYQQLQALYDELAGSKGLCILAFPCNQFGGQEPWEHEEIKKYVVDNFGVKFDMFAKIDVNGKNADPLWQYLKHKQGGTLGDFIKWNFTKFLIDKQGQPVARYAPNVEPNAIRKDMDKYW